MQSVVVGFFVLLFTLFFTACNAGSEHGFCSHPLINGGAPFRMPEGARFTTFGGLWLPVSPQGAFYVLTGAACVLEN